MKRTAATDYRHWIEASWNRCVAWGLNHDQEPVDTPLPLTDDATLEELRSATEAEVLPYYRNVLSNSRCLILLADPNATILCSWGDERITDIRLRHRFQPGISWREEACGTNAIGTAIAVGEPIQVQRNEHFLRLNRTLIGSAAPIFRANRELAGVLSVFSDAYLPQAHTLGMVRLLSLSVENRLIMKQFGGSHPQITLSSNADNFDSPWSGILVCNRGGQVIASNQRADQLLGTTTANRALSDLFRTRSDDILDYPERTPFQLVTRDKVRLSARLRRPPAAQRTGAPPDTAATDGPGTPGLEQIEYGDASVRRCADQARKVLARGVPVLITGETGVGKEVLVKALHQGSARRDKPLVSVNCAAIPPELVESELFGYEPGAFTGARAQGSLGYIRKAHTGLLFLDEIGEMPLAAQARLLRVLQEREVTPVGGTDSVPVDLLLVTATNRSLNDRIRDGQFRADLYYRINGLSVALPALRERTDRRELIEHLYRTYRDDTQPDTLAPEVLNTLEQHPWPGNIRQLVNVLRVAIAIADGDTLAPWHLPADFLESLGGTTNLGGRDTHDAGHITAQKGPDDTRVTPKPISAPDPSRTQRAAPERSHGKTPVPDTLRVYQKHEGNISRTARELNISRNTLYKRLRELGVR
ncbi:sigma-54-dependent Fis family transcriptional regulator [Marinobacter sp. C2H3]|uniref:sigma-54-dependent Fis family transcriptional regulator n=1 Tax=Marinobacter sp. C2H3 TaxID=3119003 RepID=UPI00300F728A